VYDFFEINPTKLDFRFPAIKRNGASSEKAHSGEWAFRRLARALPMTAAPVTAAAMETATAAKAATAVESTAA
jgi:hypothetical protein